MSLFVDTSVRNAFTFSERTLLKQALAEYFAKISEEVTLNEMTAADYQKEIKIIAAINDKINK